MLLQESLAKSHCEFFIKYLRSMKCPSVAVDKGLNSMYTVQFLGTHREALALLSISEWLVALRTERKACTFLIQAVIGRQTLRSQINTQWSEQDVGVARYTGLHLLGLNIS